MQPEPDFSICVPTFQRADLLPGLFARLAGLEGSFELIVVDDGSTDATAAVLAEEAARAPFPVAAISTANRGRGSALNHAFDAARGRFLFVMDDDDAIPPGALAAVLEAWNGIPEAERPGFCGVCGLAETPDGRVIGQRFPNDVEDSDFFTMRIIRRVRGDKREVVLREAVGGWRFPIVEGEKRVATNLLWFHLAARYRTRFVNRVFLVKSRRADGITASGLRQKVSSARLTAEYYRRTLADFPKMPMRPRIAFATNYLRYALHAGTPAGEALAALGMPAVAALALPAALAAVRIDRRKLAARRR